MECFCLSNTLIMKQRNMKCYKKKEEDYLVLVLPKNLIAV